uniref:Uncharacterized protein n=1 Tax=Strigamia maritima TaxID=126957 RepID=T1INK7_STRMM
MDIVCGMICYDNRNEQNASVYICQAEFKTLKINYQGRSVFFANHSLLVNSLLKIVLRHSGRHMTSTEDGEVGRRGDGEVEAHEGNLRLLQLHVPKTVRRHRIRKSFSQLHFDYRPAFVIPRIFHIRRYMKGIKIGLRSRWYYTQRLPREKKKKKEKRDSERQKTLIYLFTISFHAPYTDSSKYTTQRESNMAQCALNSKCKLTRSISTTADNKK